MSKNSISVAISIPFEFYLQWSWRCPDLSRGRWLAWLLSGRQICLFWCSPRRQHNRDSEHLNNWELKQKTLIYRRFKRSSFLLTRLRRLCMSSTISSKTKGKLVFLLTARHSFAKIVEFSFCFRLFVGLTHFNPKFEKCLMFFLNIVKFPFNGCSPTTQRVK